MELSDAALVERVLNGNDQAFEQLVKRHQNAVFGLALRQVKNRGDAEDLAQEVFVKAYKKLALYKQQYPFRNWLLGICANSAKNFFRGEARRRRAEEANAERYPRRVEEPDQEQAALEEALSAMPEKLRIALVLKHVEGLSYEEIAAILGSKVSAVKMRVKRGRDFLFQHLEGEERGHENEKRLAAPHS